MRVVFNTEKIAELVDVIAYHYIHMMIFDAHKKVYNIYGATGAPWNCSICVFVCRYVLETSQKPTKNQHARLALCTNGELLSLTMLLS